MRDQDLADSPLASHRPDIEGSADKARDFLREQFADHAAALHLAKTPADLRQLAFDLIDAALAEDGENGVGENVTSAGNLDGFLAALLQKTRSGDRDNRMRAMVMLRLLGRNPQSFQAMADELGFKTRATPHKAYRILQEELGGVPARGDKSPQAREKCRLRRIGARRENHSSFRSVFQRALNSVTLALPPGCPALN